MYAIRSRHPLTDTLFYGLMGAFISLVFTACESGDKSKRPSPPASDTALVQTAEVIIDYSSPGVKERELLDGLIPYGKIWRTGANEATNLITDKDLLVMGELLPKGRYSYFTKAGEGTWTIIVNEEWDQWGAYHYDSDKDVFRIEITPTQVEEFRERMTFYFKNEELVFHWGHLQYSLELQEAR